MDGSNSWLKQAKERIRKLEAILEGDMLNKEKRKNKKM